MSIWIGESRTMHIFHRLKKSRLQRWPIWTFQVRCGSQAMGIFPQPDHIPLRPIRQPACLRMEHRTGRVSRPAESRLPDRGTRSPTPGVELSNGAPIRKCSTPPFDFHEDLTNLLTTFITFQLHENSIDNNENLDFYVVLNWKMERAFLKSSVLEIWNMFIPKDSMIFHNTYAQDVFYFKFRPRVSGLDNSMIINKKMNQNFVSFPDHIQISCSPPSRILKVLSSSYRVKLRHYPHVKLRYLSYSTNF